CSRFYMSPLCRCSTDNFCHPHAFPTRRSSDLFLTGLVRHRLEDDFPEFVQNLAQLLFPSFLRPLPCMTIMQYEPRMQLEEAITLDAGTEFSSAPVDGQRLVFRSSFPVTLEPVELVSAQWEGGGGRARSLRLRMRYIGATAGSWRNDSLRFFL